MKEKIGKVIIVLTFVLSSMSPFVLLYTIPVFIIGVVLLWFGKNKILSKSLWTILPLLLWYPTFCIFIFLYSNIGKTTAQKLDIIFSNEFKGSVVVVSNMSCGQTIQIKDNREQLFVPKNGILLYQGDIKPSYINHRYYYQLDNGKLISLPERSNQMYFNGNKNPPASDVVGVWLNGMSSTTNSESEPTIEYRSIAFTVESKDSINKHHDFYKKRAIKKSIDSLVRICEKQL